MISKNNKLLEDKLKPNEVIFKRFDSKNKMEKYVQNNMIEYEGLFGKKIIENKYCIIFDKAKIPEFKSMYDII